MVDNRPITPQDLGFESWYHAYWHERNRANDLREALERCLRRALDAEHELSAHDCAVEFTDLIPGAIHEWKIVGSVYRWGPFGYRHALDVHPHHFAFPPFRALWLRFVRGARGLREWFTEVLCVAWPAHEERLRDRIARAALGTVAELRDTVRDYLEIRRLTARLMELT